MFKKELEFRGMNISDLEQYFQELDGTKRTNEFPLVFIGDGWQSKIIQEHIVTITSTFKVNAVLVEFQAESEKILDDIIRRYRKKTFRVGG